jgi:hypothetical protein
VWRVVMLFVNLVLGVFRLVFKVIDLTVGNLIRLVFGLVWGTVKLFLKIITLGKFGKAGAAALIVASAADDD